MSVWQKLLIDLQGHLDKHLAGSEHEVAIKLTQAVETEFLYELRGAKPGVETGNYVAMTPGLPVRIAQAPEPVCVLCGMHLFVKKVGNITYIADHGPDGATPGKCPNAGRMYKFEAAPQPVLLDVFVPDFVREGLQNKS